MPRQEAEWLRCERAPLGERMLCDTQRYPSPPSSRVWPELWDQTDAPFWARVTIMPRAELPLD